MDELEAATAKANFHGMMFYATTNALNEIGTVLKDGRSLDDDVLLAFKKLSDELQYIYLCSKNGLIQKDRLLTKEELGHTRQRG